MANPIQGMRIAYDFFRAARDNEHIYTDDEIKKFLLTVVSDEKIRNRYKNFMSGYSAEELFRRVYSLLPWVDLIVPLGQEQYPEESKESIQTPDYEVSYQAGSKDNIAKMLIEVKLVNDDKETFNLPKYKYNVLKKYEDNSKEPLLFAIFWRKYMIWTVNSIESFLKKSSEYKITFEEAIRNDLSAIMGDYSYVFRKDVYRRSKYNSIKNIDSEYYHFHQDFGRATYEGLSKDSVNYEKLCFLETPVLDCAFNFKEINRKNIDKSDTEIIEKLDFKKGMYVYRLSNLILKYLLKIYCYDNSDMYYKDNLVVQNAFGIIDTVRRKLGGEKFYSLPYNRNEKIDNLVNIQFGQVDHIYKSYCKLERKKEQVLLFPHDNI